MFKLFNMNQHITDVKLMINLMIINCFCGIVDEQRVLSLISSQNHCRSFSPSQTCNMLLAGMKLQVLLNEDVQK